MTHTITFGSLSLAALLDHLGVSQVARDRVIEIDRMIAEELEHNSSNADDCTSLVLEVADLISGRLRTYPRSLPPLDSLNFDLDAIDWGSKPDEIEDGELDLGPSVNSTGTTGFTILAT